MKIRAAITILLLSTGNTLADDITINAFNWYTNDSYCSFQLTDQSFDYNDPNTWRYVLITNLPEVDFDNLPDTPEEIAAQEQKSYATAFMSINHAFHELSMKTGSVRDDGFSIVYTTHGERPFEVTLDAKMLEKGYESQSYKGTISVIRGDATASVAFKGDCGV